MPEILNDPVRLPRRRRQLWARRVVIAVLAWTISAMTVGALGEAMGRAVRHRSVQRAQIPIIIEGDRYRIAKDYTEHADLVVLWYPEHRSHCFGWFDVAEHEGYAILTSNEDSPPLEQVDDAAVREAAIRWSVPRYLPKDTRSIARSERGREQILWLGLLLNGSISMLIVLLALCLLTSPILGPAVFRRFRSRLRLHRILCPHCAYDLSATPGPVCPECGAANPFATA